MNQFYGVATITIRMKVENEKFGKMGGKLLVDAKTSWCLIQCFLVSFLAGAAWKNLKKHAFHFLQG